MFPLKPQLPNHVIKPVCSEFVLRFCASELSVPSNATNITQIFGKSITGSSSTFNRATNLPFGFSYKIGKNLDTHKRRIIEYDIDMNNQKNFYTYNEFINYYYDEKFIENNVSQDDTLEDFFMQDNSYEKINSNEIFDRTDHNDIYMDNDNANDFDDMMA
jgi:hypothetical protein